MCVIINFDLTMNLDELESDEWPEPNYQSSLVLKCHELRKKRVCEFTVEDFRVMIGQGISLEFLVPLAINELDLNPFAEGDFFAGDLLKAISSVEREFWDVHTDYRDEMIIIIDKAVEKLNTARDMLLKT